jgi:hypothetical protein
MWGAWFLVAFFIFCATVALRRFHATRQRFFQISAGLYLAVAALVLCMALRLI